MIDGTKGKGQRSSGGEGETADPDLHPHQPNTRRSPDQPCEGGGGRRRSGEVWENGPSGSGENGINPRRAEREITSGMKYRACKP